MKKNSFEPKPIIVIAGQFASGKTEIQNRLCRKKGFVRGVPACNKTRGLRKGEVLGVDYNVLSDEAINKKIATGDVLEYTDYLAGEKIYRYAILRSSINDNKVTVFVVKPREIKKLINHVDIKKRLKIYYIVSPEDLRIKRYLEREGKKSGVDNMISSRIATDRKEFANFLDLLILNDLDYETISNNEYSSLDEIANEIYEQNKF